MNKELNLLNCFPNIKRDIKARLYNKEKNRELAMKFSQEYFDGSREQGYGGYVYDGRWIEISKKIKNLFNPKDGNNFLDVGCVGFLMYDRKRSIQILMFLALMYLSMQRSSRSTDKRSDHIK